MADSSRSQKLAAARKKLKQFQEKGKSVGNSAEPQPTAKKKAVLKAIDETQENYTRSDETEEIAPYSGAIGDHPVSPEDNSIAPSSLGERQISSTESIRQISMQLNGLMSQTHDFFNGEIELENPSITEIESRNLELAALLEKHSQVNEQLTNQVQDLKNQNHILQSQAKQHIAEAEERHRKEQGSLKEQLQVHIQTIGILVAEKTELQSSLSQSQQSAKQKAAEIEELQGRLKASRVRVADLEKELSSIALASQQFEKSSKAHAKDVDRLKLEAYKNSKILEEAHQQNSERTEKLTRTATECQNLQIELDEVKGKLSMTELYVQQLSGSSDGENKHMLEDLAQEKINLEKKLSQYEETVQTLSQERDTMAEQYQQFTKQLNQQVHSLSQQVTSLAEEKTSLLNEKSAMSSRVTTLEDQLEQQSRQSGRQTDESEMADLNELLRKLQDEKDQLLDQHRKQVSDNSQLSLLVSEHENKIQQLEASLESYQEEQVDKKQLLDEIQSDKVAASRAIAQNRQLKKQLEELQNGFIVMSNNKLELVEKLEAEQHVSKELGERLGQQEEELKELRHQLSGKEDDLNMLHKSSTELTKQMFQQQQLVDRVRHYEAQGHVTEMLNQELNQARERINALTTQNNELRTTLAQQAHQLLQPNSDTSAMSEDKESAKKDDLVASLSSSVHQLEMERDQLLLQLGQQQGQREAFRAQLKEMKESNLHHQNGSNGETVSSEEYDNLKQVMHKLENRFTKTMSDIAELSDQKQQLEHLVLQLQGETETIGEYIALYQVQRGIMKQRALEKDEYISQLARDREELKMKLTELQDLVMRLLYERQQYQANIKADVKPPGKAVASTSTPVDMSALNGVAALPDWPDLEEEFSISDSTPSLQNGTETDADTTAEPSRKQNDTTAKKIMDLITEIGSSSLVEKPVLDNFHPCPVCSGKLMTV